MMLPLEELQLIGKTAENNLLNWLKVFPNKPIKKGMQIREQT